MQQMVELLQVEMDKEIKLNQLNWPRDVIIDKKNNSLIIADQGNRRVIRWSRQNNTKNGQTIIIENIVCSHLTMDKIWRSLCF